MLIRRQRDWELSEATVTPEPLFLKRREFLRAAAVAGIGAIAGSGACSPADAPAEEEKINPAPPSPSSDLYPAEGNNRFKLDRPLTDEQVAARHNNFYEFTTDKSGVWRLAKGFKTRPWAVEVAGLVHKPATFDIDDLVRKMPLEERLYRFRCVEAWAMAVPWTGFRLGALIDLVQVKSAARFVRFVTVHRPEQMPGTRQPGGYSWPYYEGLTMAEATNELTL
ncbi:MAG: protein-methionine-sulfoxide reductase catalytic subunit MsrP, partial [Planctomycetota bacterium]